MSKIKIVLLIVAVIVFLGVPAAYFSGAGEKFEKFFDVNEPDVPAKAGMDKEKIDKEEYLKMRMEQLDLMLGVDTAKQDSRVNALAEMERAEKRRDSMFRTAPLAAWTPLGPTPIPISGTVAYSGRVSAIAVHPTNPSIAYVGTAQGGLYRTLNGGTTWTPLMDGAATLAIGAVAIAPSDPTTVYVGTGESTQCGSGCYIGIGVYRINNADTAPVLTGPLNKDASNNDVFTGRAISEILVHPTDVNTIFVSSTSGIAGIGATTTGLALPAQGVYRSTNAAGASPTFAQLSLGISNRNVTDLVMDPANPARIWAGVIGVSATDGGAYMTSNALDAAPTWTQTLSTTLTGANSRIEFAAQNTGGAAGTTTVMAASGQGTGTTYRSINGAAFTTVLANNFCGGQCFYDIAIAMDPTNANNVYLGGSPNLVFGRSTNGGTSYTSSSTGLHVDTQAITVAPSDPNTIYFGSDGGIWKSTNAGVSWTTFNNTTFSATQFESIALHPIDTNFVLGGTQDNGTEHRSVDGSGAWVQSDGGDGGFVVVDQTSPSTQPGNTIRTYHTYFNQTNTQIGFTRAFTTVAGSGDPNWTGFFGCGGTANGIACTDATLFYAPMVGGPAAADSLTFGTLYFGTNRLYRSANTGTTMTAASQQLTGANERVSAIGIAPQNDSVRLIGSTTGRVYYSNTAGASTMTDVTGTIPARYVARIAIAPDLNTAYVALNGFGIPNQHVMKTTNLSSGTPTWTTSGVGIPDAPTNSIIIDPQNSNVLYAGTDVGVFQSSDAGATWTPFGTGLPRVAVFELAIQNTARVLRAATHGKGIWETPLGTVTPAEVTVSGRVLTSDGRGLTNAKVHLSGPNGESWIIITGRRGTFSFDNVPSGSTYILSVASRRFRYEPRILDVSDSIEGLELYPAEGDSMGRSIGSIRLESKTPRR